MKEKITLTIDGTTHHLVKDRSTDENNPCNACSLKRFCAKRMETIGDTDMLCDLIGGESDAYRFGVLYEQTDFNAALDAYLFEHFAVDHNGTMTMRDNEGAHPNAFDLIEMAAYFYQLGEQNKSAEQ